MYTNSIQMLPQTGESKCILKHSHTFVHNDYCCVSVMHSYVTRAKITATAPCQHPDFKKKVFSNNTFSFFFFHRNILPPTFIVFNSLLLSCKLSSLMMCMMSFNLPYSSSHTQTDIIDDIYTRPPSIFLKFAISSPPKRFTSKELQLSQLTQPRIEHD